MSDLGGVPDPNVAWRLIERVIFDERWAPTLRLLLIVITLAAVWWIFQGGTSTA